MFKERADQFANLTPQHRLENFLPISIASLVPKEFVTATSKVAQRTKPRNGDIDFHEIAKKLVGRRFDTLNLSAYAWAYPCLVARCKLYAEIKSTNTELEKLIGQSKDFQSLLQFEREVYQSVLVEITTLFNQELEWIHQPGSPTTKQLRVVIDYIEKYFSQPQNIQKIIKIAST